MRRLPFGASSASVEATVRVEQLLGFVALHPGFEQRDVLGVLLVDEQRDLVRSERALDLQAVDDLRPRPALRRPEDDHRPARPSEVALGARRALNPANRLDGLVDRTGHQLVHLLGLVAFHEIRVPAAAPEKLLQLFAFDAG